MKYDLGGVGRGGEWRTVNLLPGAADVVADFMEIDHAIADSSAEAFRMSHTLEHIPLCSLHDFLRVVLRKLVPSGVLEVAQTDAREVLGMYAEGVISFHALRDVIFASRSRRSECIARTGRDLQQHQYMWGEQDLADEMRFVGFASVQAYDAGCWHFDIEPTMPFETNEAFFGVEIPNLGVRGCRP